MFNTVAKVASVTVLGGLGLLGGYTYLENRDLSPTNDASPAPIASAETPSEVADAEGFGGVPAGTEALPFDEGQAGEQVVLDFEDDMLGYVPSPALSDLALSDPAMPTPGLPGDEANLHTAPTVAANTLGDAQEPFTNEAGDAVDAPLSPPADIAHTDKTSITTPNDAITDTGALTGIRGLPTPSGEAGNVRAAEVNPAEVNQLEQSTDSSKENNIETPAGDISVAGLKPGMTRNPVQRDKADAKPRMIANKAKTDKPDSGKFFKANKAKIDKPDDSSFFTTDAKDVGASDPCLKSDGTRYEGPGTALNPFADQSPCLPQATAESFDIAGSDTLPVTESDADGGRFGLPLQDGFFGPLVPLAPNGGNFGSDYRSVL
ncbi:MAG: hypothetical protein AAF986_01815 [Pseudomonadota bacterium]